MKLINITATDIREAKLLASSMGELQNSITKGQGNVHGFLGEIITSKILNNATSSRSQSLQDYQNLLKVD